MSKRWTREEENALMDMRKQGLPFEVIAERLGRTKKGVAQKTFNIKYGEGKDIDPGVVERIRSMTGDGMSCREIGLAIGISEWQVSKIKNYYGMTKGKKPAPKYRKEDDTLCWYCRNTHKDKCTWFDPDNPVIPDNAKVIMRKDLQTKTKKNNGYLFKVVSCPNFEEMEE